MNKWHTKNLEEVCNYIGRGISPKYVELNGICVLNQKCIRNHKIDFTKSRRHDNNKKSVSNDKLVQKWDVLINSTGVGTLGRVAQVVDVPNPTTVDSHVSIVRPKPDTFYGPYFGYALVGIEAEIEQKGRGAVGQTELPRKVIGGMKISYPEKLEVQEVIVKKIDEMFSVVDKNELEIRKNIGKLYSYKYSIMSKILNGSYFKSKESWRTIELKDVVKEIRYGSSKKTNDSADGVTVLRMGNYDEFGKKSSSGYKYLPKHNNEFPSLLLETGDLLFNRTNSAELVGKSTVYDDHFPNPCSYASYLIRARFDLDLINPRYVMYVLNSLIGKKWIKEVVNQQVGQANVNGTKLKHFSFKLPPKVDQDNSVEILDRSFSVVDNNLLTFEGMLKKSSSLRKSILKTAFEDKLI